MSEHKLFKVNQAIILKDGAGRILLLEQDDKWMLPGGRLEEGESALDGLRRELFEETGITDFSVDSIADVQTSRSGNTYVVTFVGAVAATPNIALSEEHQDGRWFSVGEIEDLKFGAPEVKDIILKFFFN